MIHGLPPLSPNWKYTFTIWMSMVMSSCGKDRTLRFLGEPNTRKWALSLSECVPSHVVLLNNALAHVVGWITVVLLLEQKQGVKVKSEGVLDSLSRWLINNSPLPPCSSKRMIGNLNLKINYYGFYKALRSFTIVIVLSTVTFTIIHVENHS